MKARSVVATVTLLLTSGASYAGFFGPFNPVPEPSSIALFAIGGGAAAAAYLRRRKNRK